MMNFDVMRKFRFIGDPKDYGSPYIKGRIYDSSFKVDEDYDNVGISALFFNDDWEEVFEDETPILHKDTDLGYFAGVAMGGLLAGNRSKTVSAENLAYNSIIIAKELIKQLDEQNK